MYSNADIKNETSKMVNYGARIPTLAKDSGTKIFGNDSNAIDKRFEKTRSSNFGGYKTQERSYVEILIINSYEYFMKYGSSNQTASATCSTMDLCCDPMTCSVRSSRDKCREAVSDCDKAEYCDGWHAQCPSDLYRRSGASCQANGVSGHCYVGSCRTFYSQCLKLFQSDSLHKEDESRCWQLNKNGKNYGNCGLSEDGDVKACNNNHKKCGKLQCVTDNTARGNPKVSGSLYWFNFTVPPVICNVFASSLKSSSDTGDDLSYVLDGTWCDRESFCHKKQCLHISKIQGLTSCPDNCYGRGDCHPLIGKCDCDKGFYGSNCNATLRQGALMSLSEQDRTKPDLKKSSNSFLKFGERSVILVWAFAMIGGL
ncbi:disintegrin and metalloproteinase domain-containing protein adm-2-like [Convolutriloba macropyga]|uniref:disintegrin and metalloproteinase domain-containing protein adm-2-like n=1 Tax=Convolutriloba macropyga TaxID=536237 RepID=UPI003F51DC8A